MYGSVATTEASKFGEGETCMCELTATILSAPGADSSVSFRDNDSIGTAVATRSIGEGEATSKLSDITTALHSTFPQHQLSIREMDDL